MNPFPTISDDGFANLLDTSIEYRVAFLPYGETLAVRNGVDDAQTFEEIASLQNGDSVLLTGETQVIDGDLWMAIGLDDQVGWVLRNTLIGNLDRELFCEDPRIEPLFSSLEYAVQNEDSDGLSELVSPRGLYLGFDGGAAIHFTTAEISSIFEDERLRNWGSNGLTPDELTGSLVDLVIPTLHEDLLSQDRIIACNDNQDLLSTADFLYALRIDGFEGYGAITNFYSVMHPGSPGYELEWSAWGLAFEYWDGQPRLMGLAQYRWMP